MKTWSIALLLCLSMSVLSAHDVEKCCVSESSTSFEALEVHVKEVLIKWTIEEQDLRKGSYVVERSFDGVNFEVAGETPLKKSTKPKNYVLMDLLSKNGRVYYRLAEKKSSGKSKVLGMTSVDVGKQKGKKKSKERGVAFHFDSAQ